MQETTCLEKQPLSQEMLEKMDAYWRAANYLSAGQLYLLDNPLLKEPAEHGPDQEEDRRPLGAPCSGQNFDVCPLQPRPSSGMTWTCTLCSPARATAATS